jgi:acyl-CoA dehydrogenase
VDYAAPLNAIAFTLRRIAGFDALAGSPAFPDLDWPTAQGVLEEAGRFSAQRLAPLDAPGDRIGAHWDDGRVTQPPLWRETYRAWADGGWMGVAQPVDQGGMGLPALLSAAVLEIWTGGCFAFALNAMLTQSVCEALRASAAPALRDAWLPHLVSGQWTATMVLTESQAGSDLGALRTRATPAGDGAYRISGSKIFISFGEHDLADNIVHLVLARLPDAPAGSAGISLFLVPKLLPGPNGALGDNGVRCVGIEDKLGLHASPTASLAFEDAVGWRVGEPNRGLAAMFLVMNRARLATGLQGVGIAEKACQQALAYARERRQGRTADGSGDGAIIGHPDVLRMLLTMRAQTAAIRALAYAAAAAIDAAEHAQDPAERAAAEARAALLTPMVKAFCTDTAFEVASLNVQVHGGMGYIEDTGAAQLMRDVRVTSIYEGTNGIQANDLVLRKVIKDAGAEAGRLIAELEQTAKLAEAQAPLQAQGLAQAAAALRRSTAWLLDNAADAPAVLASASAYLKLFATTACAGFLTKGALAGEGDPAGREFSVLAEVFAAQVLPPAIALEGVIAGGARAVLDGRDLLA